MNDLTRQSLRRHNRRVALMIAANDPRLDIGARALVDYLIEHRQTILPMGTMTGVYADEVATLMRHGYLTKHPNVPFYVVAE